MSSVALNELLVAGCELLVTGEIGGGGVAATGVADLTLGLVGATETAGAATVMGILNCVPSIQVKSSAAA